MAIAKTAQYAHLSTSDIETLGRELDTIRTEVEKTRGERDATYIRRVIGGQRALDAAARLLVLVCPSRTGWVLGTVALAVAKSIENMEIGHNVCHGQWDWMNDPEIHSTTWEWDMVALSSHWRHSHNYRHHLFTNIVGMDADLGFNVMRVSRDQPWRRHHALQPLANVMLAVTFEWAIALSGLDSGQNDTATRAEKKVGVKSLIRKIARQTVKDYVLFPALSGPRWRGTLTANATANLLRNLWAYLVIFCGHFPDGAEKFSPAVIECETKPEWYLRQILGTANFHAGRVLAFMSGNLCYQIEHHLFPDLPSNRYAEIAQRVRALCDTYDLPYTTGPLFRQYRSTLRTIHQLALPDRYLPATCGDTPETPAEHGNDTGAPTPPATAENSRRHGLRAALRQRTRKEPNTSGDQ